MVAPARGGPAAGAVPAPDRRVLSVPGRGACGLRPHPPAARGGPSQRCFPEHRLHGLPEETPSFATAWSHLSRPTTALRTGERHRNVGGSVHLRDGRGCGPDSHRRPLPCCSSLSRRMPCPGFSGGTCCPPRLQSLVARDVDPVSDSSPALCLFPSATWGRGRNLRHRSGGLPASRAEATCSDGGAASELMTTRRQTSKRFGIFLPILPSGSR